MSCFVCVSKIASSALAKLANTAWLLFFFLNNIGRSITIYGNIKNEGQQIESSAETNIFKKKKSKVGKIGECTVTVKTATDQ